MAKVEFDDDELGIEGNEEEVRSTEVESSRSSPDAGSFNREQFESDTYNEGAEEAVLEGLANKEDITIDDLRTIPGSESLTDAQLTAAWEAAQGEVGAGEERGEGTKVELPFPVYDEQGNKVASDKVTLGDLLSGKVSIGYNAMGKEQRKSLTDVLRNASQGHWNEHRYNTVNEQYRQSHQRAVELENQVKNFEQQQSQWNAALTSLVMGDNAPMKALVEAYKGALGKTGFTPEGFVPQDTVRAQAEAAQRGQEWYTTVGMPAAIDISSRYNANPQEVIGAIQWFINNEPVLTPQRIQEILQYDVPMAFEAQGYVANTGAGTGGGNTGNGVRDTNGSQSNAEVSELRKQVQALSAQLAGNKNERTNVVRERQRRAPSAGSGATPGAGDSMPNFKDRNSMKEWLQR